MAAEANRLAGKLANPTPATQVAEIIKEIPKALEAVLNEAEKAQEQTRPTTKAATLGTLAHFSSL
jgi:hypothetical protein